jgi:hypothetical protein
MTFAAGASAEPMPPGSPGSDPGWASVGEALANRSWAVVEQCRVVGRDLAERGVSIGEALGELRSTTRRVSQRDPEFAECLALAQAWEDATLGYLNRLSCTDPLTGLDSQAHLVALLRTAPATPSALVVVEVPRPDNFFALAHRLTQIGDLARAVFPSARATARVGVRRLVVLAPLGFDFETRRALLERAVGTETTTWTEALPGDPADHAVLVDHLARD